MALKDKVPTKAEVERCQRSMTSQTSELVEAIAREIAVYLTKRRDVLDVILAGNAELGLAMMNDLAHRIATLLERISSSEVTEEEVERVARAIYEATDQPYGWDDAPPISYRRVAIDQARAAITAMRSAATSERKG